MKTYLYAIAVAFFCGLSVSSLADRTLNAAETEALLRTLTGSPRRHWIESGTLTARHLEYRRADDYFAQTEETIVSDGQRFRWEITLNAEETAGEEAAVIRDKRVRNQPDKTANQKRVFCWDGQTYTRYYPQADYAVVSSDTAESSLVLVGPLTAGIVPWGHGDYQISPLLSRRPTAREIVQDGRTLIRLEMINPAITPALHTIFILDPAKNYAVLSFVMENEIAVMENTYTGYTNTQGRWIPRIIRTERFEKTPDGPQLVSYEDWEFTEVRVQTPSGESLKVPFQNGTLVEMHPGGGRKSFLYHASDRADISGLILEKLSVPSSSGEDPQNCASAAVGLMAKRFSRSIAKEKIASLAAQESGQTSLYEVRRKLEEAGLYCMAVRTDLESLRGLSGCGVIVHLPNQSHYVIVDRIEEEWVWTIDLTSRKFYWKWKKSDFAADWKEGTALLVSDQPTRLPTHWQTLEPMRLYEIMGGDGEYETYSCTEKIQNEDWIPCPKPIGGFLCGGTLFLFYERYGCIEDQAGGTCIGSPMIGYSVTPCKNDPYYQGFCKASRWSIGLLRACR